MQPWNRTLTKTSGQKKEPQIGLQNQTSIVWTG